MATPLTVCLVVAGRHVERLKFLEIMLGDRPPLKPAQLCYQRLLAADPLEAAEQAHDLLKSASLEDYCDTILLEGLRLAEADRRLGHLDEDRLNRIASTVDELVADLETHHDVGATDLPSLDMSASPGAAIVFEQSMANREPIEDRNGSPRSVLCIPGSGKLDEAAALVLAYLLRHRGIGASAEKADALSMSKFLSLDMTDTSLACVCYVDQPSTAKIQATVRRLNNKKFDARILLALLGVEATTPPIAEVATLVSCGSFSAALNAIIQATAKESDGATVDGKDVTSEVTSN
jgi:hypothetical protein